MTTPLYMESSELSYIKNFDAVLKEIKDASFVLNRTAFYPHGGGQPSDRGILSWDGGVCKVKNVRKKGNDILHYVDDVTGELPPPGTDIQGFIDWDLRYSHMKMHTCQHLLSGIIYDDFGALTSGNQIHDNYSRVDFSPADFSENDIIFIEEKVNDAIANSLDVNIEKVERAHLKEFKERCNLHLIPSHISELRVVKINNYDICPCAGTHVKNTSEIGIFKIIKKQKKGKNTTRIIYELQPRE